MPTTLVLQVLQVLEKNTALNMSGVEAYEQDAVRGGCGATV